MEFLQRTAVSLLKFQVSVTTRKTEAQNLHKIFFSYVKFKEKELRVISERIV